MSYQWWIFRCPWSIEINYNQGGKLFGHAFKINLIKAEYGNKLNNDTAENLRASFILKYLHQVMGYKLDTYK